MPDEIRRIDYYSVSVPDKPGEGAPILTSLQEAGVKLTGISAFPHGARRTQLDLIPADSGHDRSLKPRSSPGAVSAEMMECRLGPENRSVVSLRLACCLRRRR